MRARPADRADAGDAAAGAPPEETATVVEEASRHALFALNREGRVLYANRCAAALAGCPSDRLRAARPWRPDTDAASADSPTATGTVPAGFVTQFLAGDRWLRARALPFEYGLAVKITELDERPETSAEADPAVRARRQAIVAELAQAALAGDDPEALADAAARGVAEGLGVELAGVLRLAPDGKTLVLGAGVGWRDGLVGRAGIAADGLSPAARAFRTGVPIAAEDLPREKRLVVRHVGLCWAYGAASVTDVRLWAHGVASVMGAVIRGRGEPLGVLEAASRAPRAFTPGEAGFLEAVANVLGAAIERRAAEERVQRLALRDPLTGLPNRLLLRERVEDALARVRRSGETMALLALDLDRFKPVNDTLGHAAGDLLLVETARRLRSCVRESDTVARVGGDEFAIVLGDLRGANDVATVAQKIVDALNRPLVLGGRRVRVGASVGIAVCPADGADHDSLLRNADIALYRAKAGARSTYRFYTAQMAVSAEERRALARDLRLALDRGGFDLHYQPRLDVGSGRVVGVEALLRWQHPQRGLLLPGAFLDVAESSGLMVRLGEWVLRRACAQAAAWRDAGLPPVSVAVNLSPAQCRRADLAATVERACVIARIDPRWLRLEVAEEVFEADPDEAGPEGLYRLHRLGVGVSIEGFGAGPSRVARLRRRPADELKLHPCLIAGLGRDVEAEVVARSLIGLGRTLGLRVAAAGVETPAQLAFLRAEGCEVAQGYHLGRPLPAPDCTALLIASRSGLEHREITTLSA